MAQQVDFDALVQRAQSSGDEQDRDAYWRAFFELDTLCFLQSPMMNEPDPLFGRIDGQQAIWVFTDRSHAEDYARAVNLPIPAELPLVAELPFEDALLNIEVRQGSGDPLYVRVNDGPGGWFIPAPGIRAIRSYLAHYSPGGGTRRDRQITRWLLQFALALRSGDFDDVVAEQVHLDGFGSAHVLSAGGVHVAQIFAGHATDSTNPACRANASLSDAIETVSQYDYLAFMTGADILISLDPTGESQTEHAACMPWPDGVLIPPPTEIRIVEWAAKRLAQFPEPADANSRWLEIARGSANAIWLAFDSVGLREDDGSDYLRKQLERNAVH